MKNVFQPLKAVPILGVVCVSEVTSAGRADRKTATDKVMELLRAKVAAAATGAKKSA